MLAFMFNPAFNLTFQPFAPALFFGKSFQTFAKFLLFFGLKT